jgi:hypothetical protein
MESIKQEEKHIACRYCGGVVYSSQPACAKCGLEMTSQGIVELSEIEDKAFQALGDIYKLKMTSALFPGFTIIGFILASIIEIKFFFYVYFLMGIVAVGLNFIGWNQKYSAVDFSPEDGEYIKTNKRQALTLFLGNLIIGLGIHFLGLK